jgi:hypothetical protein
MKLSYLLTLVAAPVLLATIAGAQEVTFDVSGTYPANMPVTKMTAPSASFLLEFTVQESVPATPPNSPLAFQTPILSGSYSFEGQTYPSTATSYFIRSDLSGNLEGFSLHTRFGALNVQSIPASHTPFLSMRNNNTATAMFLTGDLGAGGQWIAGYVPTNRVGGAGGTVTISEVVSRLASPHAAELP